jgi:hypothetical protein
VLQLVDQRDGEILHRDPALAVVVRQKLIAAEPELPGPLTRRELRGWRQERPIEHLLPEGIDAAGLVVIAVVDFFNDVAERNEKNNVAVSPPGSSRRGARVR